MITRLRSRAELWRFIKFLFVGVLNTAFGFSVYAVLIWLGLPPQPALALSYVLGVLWNYGTHGRLVFANRGFGRLPLYALSYCATYGVNAALLALLLASGLPPLWAQALLVLPMAMVAYCLISYVLTGSWPLSRRAGGGR